MGRWCDKQVVIKELLVLQVCPKAPAIGTQGHRKV